MRIPTRNGTIFAGIEDEYQEDRLENATHASVSTLRWNYSILPENSTEALHL